MADKRGNRPFEVLELDLSGLAYQELSACATKAGQRLRCNS